MSHLQLQQIIERLANLLRNETRQAIASEGLLPIQFEALHYLAISNRYSNTPMAVTEYLGQTKGTVSQTLKVLEKNSLIEGIADVKDKRVRHLILTAKGKQVVKRVVPSKLLQLGSQAMTKAEIEAATANLLRLLRLTQAANGFKAFGECFTCKHHITLPAGKARCGLTHESLSKSETELICREHTSI